MALALCAAPYLVHAQAGNASLSETIRAAILSDPRTAQMTEAEIDAMVAALAEEAEAQGVTSYDILWQPQEPVVEAVVEQCGSMSFLCALNEAFGLDGSDVGIPIGLGIVSALLLFVIGSILLHKHGHHPVVGSLKSRA